MQAWLKEHDITFDESLIKINTDPYSITSLQPLAVGTVICQIPKTAILSCKTTAIADILEQEQLAGILGLAVALMFEWSLGERSPWSTYIESLPSLDTVPLFWTPEQLEHLAGTDLGNALPSERDYFIVDFAELVVPLVAKHGLNKEFMTCERFMQATFVHLT